MQHATNTPTRRRPARKLRDEHSSLPLSGSNAYQVGRVRAWLSRHAGLLCLGVGWLVAFGIVFVPKGDATVVVELGLAGAALLGFGIGWIVGHGKGKL